MDRFPSTSWELLADASRRGDEWATARNELAERYYAAVRAYIAAITRNTVDPDDLTQRFFETVVLSGRLLQHADREKGRFRPYLKQSIRNFLVDEHRRQARSVAGDVHPDAVANGWSAIAADQSPTADEEMLRAWARSLVAMAVARLEKVCAEKQQSEHFQLFARRYLADPDQTPSWRDIGTAFGLDEKIARSRADTVVRQFRSVLRELVETDIGAEGDIDKELQDVIAIL